MNKKILLGVDAEFSQATQRALLAVSEFYEQSMLPYSLLLVNVIPIAQPATSHPAMYLGNISATITPAWQRTQAEEMLLKARQHAQELGISAEHIETIVRVGATADELVKVAREQHVHLIVLGNRGESWKQKLRRLLIGSITRRVLHFAPCPVLIVVPPSAPDAADLVSWYTDAIGEYLSKHCESLSVFTPEQVAKTFKVPGRQKHIISDEEIAAAARALEHLAQRGKLCRHQVAGEVRYIND